MFRAPLCLPAVAQFPHQIKNIVVNDGRYSRAHIAIRECNRALARRPPLTAAIRDSNNAWGTTHRLFVS